jgi:predicted site-specific integrase-resolvase
MEPRLRKVKSEHIFSPETLLTSVEVCKMLRISRRTLTRWCSSKPPKLSYIAFGPNTVMFRRQLIEYFLEQREIRGIYHLPQ